MARKLSVPEKHQLKIARDTLKYHDAAVGFMGGPSKEEAREIILRLTGKRAVESNPPRKFRPHEPFKVTKWEERDRLHIGLTDRATEQEEIADWWDDDARQMFEDGFFDARRLEHSVIEYAYDVGILPRKKVRKPRGGGIGVGYSWNKNPPKMTRQDFQLIADVIADLDLSDAEDKRHIAYRFATALSLTNPNFHKQKFIDAAMRDGAGGRGNVAWNPRGEGGTIISNNVKEIRYRHAKGSGRLYKHEFGAGVVLYGSVDGSLVLKNNRGKSLWENRTVGDKE